MLIRIDEDTQGIEADLKFYNLLTWATDDIIGAKTIDIPLNIVRNSYNL